MENASDLSSLYNNLPLKDDNKSFKLVPEKLTVGINYKENVGNIGEHEVKKL
ncbi:hypothetical protein AAGC94_05115 [Clostridium sporogenes]|uniref:Uncharacterized protein n=1 Tax=Clostridium sporogenes TaxID=1509 RepID=A0A7U4JNH9_CLOSG|nr:hypothetical protein [Clostridium sporogenes]STC77810.1 Uncharacterised protein [Clostridium botulinum]AKC62392.1 hypothetical protein CLSPO_c16720 [Clostridium sporogenes]KCZ69701.1 hypothetical protein CSPO_4c12260 [Clostridium sporogenes]MBW5456184.1 hypothetical protein [Clostridium sporogenes]SQC04731.1 Uncharacterised protein [Clostridium sporogenes]